MADVTGPISSLPGSAHCPPEGMTCDECDNLATIRVQGETDSFGSEMSDYCDECWKRVKADWQQPMIGRCEWCEGSEVELTTTRDPDEGMYGPVYHVCKPCAKKQRDRLNEEYEQEFGFNDLPFYEDEFEDQDDYIPEEPEDETFGPDPNFKVFFFKGDEKLTEEVFADDPLKAAAMVRKMHPGTVTQKVKAIGRG